MDVARRANSFDELTSSGVRYKGMRRRRRINTTSILTEVMAGPKREWMKTVENMADEKYPAWRAHLQATGERLPADVAEGLQQRSTWLALRLTYVKGLLAWLGASDEPSLVDELSGRLDAAIEFVSFVTQEFLLRKYNLEKHRSDVFDHFQLLHLAIDRFVIVSADPDLLTRTRLSPQASRIMTFGNFSKRSDCRKFCSSFRCTSHGAGARGKMRASATMGCKPEKLLRQLSRRA